MNGLPAQARRLANNSDIRQIRRLLATSSLQHVRHYTPPPITGVTESEINSARAHCSSLLRKFDTPSHILSPFVPRHAQTAYLALRALNVDVARVPDATSNPQVGNLRLQFWRDAITRALDLRPPKEPVAVLLAAAQAFLLAQTDGGSKLSRVWLHRVVNEREKHLHNRPYVDLASLESYAENSYSSLLYATLQAAGITSLTADHVASHIGKAQGIVAVLRGLPLLAFPGQANHHSMGQEPRQGVVMLPLDVMAERGVKEHEVLKRGADATGLRDAVFTVATRANDHLITAREMLKNLRAGQDVGHEFEHGDDEEHVGGRQQSVQGQAAEVEQAFGVLMPAIATQEWLDRLQRVDFDVFQPKLRTSDWKLPLRAYWNYTRRRL